MHFNENTIFTGDETHSGRRCCLNLSALSVILKAWGGLAQAYLFFWNLARNIIESNWELFSQYKGYTFENFRQACASVYIQKRTSRDKVHELTFRLTCVASSLQFDVICSNNRPFDKMSIESSVYCRKQHTLLWSLMEGSIYPFCFK